MYEKIKDSQPYSQVKTGEGIAYKTTSDLISGSVHDPVRTAQLNLPSNIDGGAFVDPDGMPARELIQSVGLSGIREGDVSLDTAQPHYLVAHSGATSDQCLRLIERVREQVLLQTGIDLQLNLQIW